MSATTLNAGSKTTLDLHKLVNLALNSPRVGIVNFNVLKIFLVELLKALNLQNHEPKFGDDPEIKYILNCLMKANEQHHEYAQEEKDIDADTGYESELVNMSVDRAGLISAKSHLTFVTDGKSLSERCYNLEEKLGRLEQQIGAINTLPPNAHLIEKAKESRKSHSATGPILEIWQYTQLSKRTESNEDGITKLTSLMQDLIGDLNELKDGQIKNAGELSRMNDNYNSLLEKLKSFEKMQENFPSKDELKDLEREIELLNEGLKNLGKFEEKLRVLTSQVKTIENKIIPMATQNDLVDFVTWSALENALKGLKDMLDQKEKERTGPQIPTATQTTPVITPAPSRPQSSQPSNQLQEILSKLGTLNNRHEDLKQEVEDLKNELANKLRTPTPKIDTPQPSFQLPDDFVAKIDEIMKMKGELEELRDNLKQESTKRVYLENLISNLNDELDKLKKALKECLDTTKVNKDDISSLKEAIKMLDENKVDKDWIRQEFDKKADKKDLDNKVHRKTFEEVCNEMSHNINNCIQKSSNIEDEMVRGNERVKKELDCKLDRGELDPLKEYIEKQLKRIRKLQKEAQNNYLPMEDDAAGLRKQLLRFHCLSCDRPIETSAHQALPSLPGEKGMRPIQSPRPFTTFELDQIRQFQKQQMLQEHGYDLFATVRQCGGAHTLTLPHKKTIKVPQQIAEEANNSAANANNAANNIPSHRSEVQLQGQDGHIYKGRIEGRIDAKLNVEMKRQVKSSTNPIHIHGQNQYLSNSTNNMSAFLDRDRPNSAAGRTENVNNNTSNNKNSQNNDDDKMPVFIN